jgi:hypothetical protein
MDSPVPFRTKFVTLFTHCTVRRQVHVSHATAANAGEHLRAIRG